MKISRAVSLAATFVAVSLSLQATLSPSAEAAQTPERPNVLVIVTDDQDVESLAVMRNLMSHPGGSWITFSNAFANATLCAPSRASLLTGQYEHNHRVSTNFSGDKLDERTLLPVWLDDVGYNTALIGKYHLRTGARYRPRGWDQRIYARGRDGDVDAYTQAAVNYIGTTTAPWFVLLSYSAPHAIANPPERYKDTPIDLPAPRPNVNELDVSDKPIWLQHYPLLIESTLAKWQRERTNSWRETLAIDDGIEQIVATLQATGELDNTLIIYVADHGFSWGSHRKMGKWCPYEECSRVPMLIRFPGAAQNRTETRMVSMVDLAATIADYTGVVPTRPQDGRSLMPLLTNSATEWRNSVIVERHINDDYVGVRVPGWKYIEFRRGFREMYDLTADPYEMENIANEPQYAAQQAELASELHELLDCAEDCFRNGP